MANKSFSENSTFDSSIYKVDADNWYSAKPYGFKTLNNDKAILIMYLPISPSNLSINTNFATNLIPTLYGTVEEHSEVRYFDISIEGTTGFAPKYITPFDASTRVDESTGWPVKPEAGRTSFPVAGFNLSGFFAKTIELSKQIKNKASDIGKPEQPKLGIDKKNSGYLAFHNLYRFLLSYKKDVVGGAINNPLVFFNYKDGIEYNVVVRNFLLRRSSENPMLYNYSIQLTGYNMRAIGSTVGKSSKEELEARIKTLGLDGVQSSSIFAKIRAIADAAKATAGAAVGLASSVGK